ncbi:MAG TPA: M1 family metallopeptidase, partial [Thermoanaerobaculia bacterium]|nr:M1 family metallopeptidase [Thermoanaerobaculia bacterium]
MIRSIDWLAVLPALLAAVPALAQGSTSPGNEVEAAARAAQPGADPHSYARPAEIRVKHVALKLDVDFERKVLSGRATLTLTRDAKTPLLYLDSRGLDIKAITLADGKPVAFALGPESESIGQALVVDLGPEGQVVNIDYATRPDAAALQWLSPAQTADGKQPFLFTQSEPILARTWIPLQDSPGVRFTYEAEIHVPPGLLALMSAENPQAVDPKGLYRFKMDQAIPAYLMALAVGDLAFRSTGLRTGVYAEPSKVDKAAWEFANTEAMIKSAEQLYGGYQWGRYDLLVLPPSFPYGGMENPRLTFVTPTVIAGDRSLTSLVAHELAHSWSGNLVTNATWNDFWLNEGFTVYFERRIMEAVSGRPYAEMLASLGLTDLRQQLQELGPGSRDSHLYGNYAGRNPDHAVNAIAYEKGYFFLRTLEAAVGRPDFDRFLRNYFETFAFRSMSTKAFSAFLDLRLPQAKRAVNVDAWISGPDLPEGADLPKSDAFTRVETQVARFAKGARAAKLPWNTWNTQERLHFLESLPAKLPARRLKDLDETYHLSTSGNSEILVDWLQIALRNQYQAAYPAVESFLEMVGRRKYLRPLYAEMVKTPEGKAMAERIYTKARPSY